MLGQRTWDPDLDTKIKNNNLFNIQNNNIINTWYITFKKRHSDIMSILIMIW